MSWQALESMVHEPWMEFDARVFAANLLAMAACHCLGSVFSTGTGAQHPAAQCGTEEHCMVACTVHTSSTTSQLMLPIVPRDATCLYCFFAGCCPLAG